MFAARYFVMMSVLEELEVKEFGHANRPRALTQVQSMSLRKGRKTSSEDWQMFAARNLLIIHTSESQSKSVFDLLPCKRMHFMVLI
jgi:hypothetical protein